MLRSWRGFSCFSAGGSELEDRRIAEDIFHCAVASVNPYGSVRDYLVGRQEMWRKGVYVVGFGKAAVPMARACEDVLGDRISGGYLITRYGHGGRLTRLTLREAGHPLPDENSLRFSGELLRLVRDMPGDSDMICLISGGGSALFARPSRGLSLEDKMTATDLLLKAGADIFELNTVRKHLSDVKGGRFLRYFRGESLVSLILSDVIGDRLDVIASGPTVHDESTYSEALEVVHRYGLEGSMPQGVMNILLDGARGILPETVKKDDPLLERTEHVIIGSLDRALDAACRKAEEFGMHAIRAGRYVTGEAREAGKRLAGKVLGLMSRDRPLCLVSGGETTVTVRGDGKGGRNMELAAGFALEISGITGVTLLSAGTDGSDGPTDAAGAVVDGRTVERARKSGLDLVDYLDCNDTYSFFEREGGLFRTGPTGTNVMDIQIVIVR